MSGAAPASSLIEGIGDLVEGAIAQITGLVDGVRDRAQLDTPCDREQILNEARTNVLRNIAGKAATVARYREAGERAVEAALGNQGRPSSAHAGGQSFAAWLVDTVLPVPSGVTLAAIFGGPIGGGAAMAAWTDWIDNRLPSGRPSGSNQGTKVLGMSDVRLKGGRLQGSAVRAAWDAWAAQQALVVYPPGRPGWRGRVEGVEAKLATLDERLAALDAEIVLSREACAGAVARGEARADATLAAQIEAARAAARLARLQALAPYALGALVLVGVMRRSR